MNITELLPARKTGIWLLEVDDREPGDTDAQVAELLDRLTPNLTAWSNLSQKYEIGLFCGLFKNDTNEAFTLSSSTLLSLTERGIEICFDVYAPDGEEISPATPCPCRSGKSYTECCAPKTVA